MIKKGDEVKIKPEWQDDGDDEFIWVAADDEENGRVAIYPSNINTHFKPTHVVNIFMLEL